MKKISNINLFILNSLLLISSKKKNKKVFFFNFSFVLYKKYSKNFINKGWFIIIIKKHYINVFYFI